MIRRSFIRYCYQPRLFCCAHQIHSFPSRASCSSLVNQNGTIPLEFLNATSGNSKLFQMRGLRKKVSSAKKEEEPTHSSSSSAADLDKKIQEAEEKMRMFAMMQAQKTGQRMAEQPTMRKKIGVFFEDTSNYLNALNEGVPHIEKLRELQKKREAMNLGEKTEDLGPNLSPEQFALLMEFHNKFSEFMKEFMRKQGKQVTASIPFGLQMRFGIARTDSLRPAIQEFVNKFNEEHAKKTGLEIEVTHMDMINLKMMGLYCALLTVTVYFMMKRRPKRDETFEQNFNLDQLPESTKPQLVQPTGMSTELYTFCCLLLLFFTTAIWFRLFLIKKRDAFRVVQRNTKGSKKN